MGQSGVIQSNITSAANTQANVLSTQANQRIAQSGIANQQFSSSVGAVGQSLGNIYNTPNSGFGPYSTLPNQRSQATVDDMTFIED